MQGRAKIDAGAIAQDTHGRGWGGSVWAAALGRVIDAEAIAQTSLMVESLYGARAVSTTFIRTALVSANSFQSASIKPTKSGRMR